MRSPGDGRRRATPPDPPVTRNTADPITRPITRSVESHRPSARTSPLSAALRPGAARPGAAAPARVPLPSLGPVIRSGVGGGDYISGASYGQGVLFGRTRPAPSTPRIPSTPA